MLKMRGRSLNEVVYYAIFYDIYIRYFYFSFPLQEEYDTSSIFMRSTAGLNSEFSFT